jgi:transcriptional regulator with XRE-family HTH domain
MDQKRQSPLAVLREVCGLTQRELADMVGRSVHTVRAIEQGKLAIGKEFAEELSKETGVSPDHLLFGLSYGEEFTAASFEAHRASLQSRQSFERHLEFVTTELRRILKVARQRPDYDLAAYRVERFLEQLEKDFSPDILRPKFAKGDPKTEAILKERVAKFKEQAAKFLKSAESKKKRS